MQPKDLILNIRKKYTGENSTINSDGVMVVENLTQMLTSAISELAKNIYKKDSHFIMELIQNADDNEYASNKTPTLKIIQDADKVIFQNNEVGFNPKNIESICSISDSTKGIINGQKGYIGEKGIGFKSVFRVCDQPEIYSNGYQFKFNSHSAKIGKRKNINLGYILPAWIDDPSVDIVKSYTNIVLPFKNSLSLEEKEKITHIKPDLLLFLNKLRRIEIIDNINDQVLVVTKEIKDDVITLQELIKRVNEKASNSKRRFKVFERILKVPNSIQIPQRKNVTNSKIILSFPLDNKSNFKYDEEQFVYSFLPIINGGFRFIIQADFILTSGRESIDEDNQWNHWIRDELFNTFKAAIEEFKKHPTYKYSFIHFIPYCSESFSDFFQPLAQDIIDYSLGANIVLSQSLKWRNPSQVILGNAEEKRIFENDLLKVATKKEYLNESYYYNEEIIETLKIDTFCNDDMLECLNVTPKLKLKKSEWFVELFSFLQSREGIYSLTNSLSKLAIVPLKIFPEKLTVLASPATDHIFFPLEKEMSFSFEGSINIIDRNLLDHIRNLKNRKIRKKIIDFLIELGVKKPSPYFIIKNFILQKYETDDWKKIKLEVLIDHIRYIKHHWASLKPNHSDIINLIQDKPIINTKSIGDGKRYFSYPKSTYIPGSYGNKNSLEVLFSGINSAWFINDCYFVLDKPSQVKNEKEKKEIILDWFNFFKTLGCKEIPDCSDESSEKNVLDVIALGKPDKLNQLLILINKHWPKFKRNLYKKSFLKKAWFEQLSTNMTIPIGKKLYYANNIFLKKKNIQDFFGDSVKYYPREISIDFAEMLGINVTVDSKSIIRYLSELSDNHKKLTKERAIKIYKSVANDDDADLSIFNSTKLIYLNDSGKWFTKNEVFWTDQNRIFGKKYGYCEYNFPLQLKDFFVEKIGVRENPQIDDYILELKRLSELSNSRGLQSIEIEIIYNIYHELGKLSLSQNFEDEQFNELNGLIWSSREAFWFNDKDLFYNDNEEFFNLFKDQEEIAFVDIPQNYIPITKKLWQILGIPPVSSVIKSRIIGDIRATLDQKSTNRIRKYADSIISLIYSEYTYFYEENKAGPLFNYLRNIEIYECFELNVEYSLNNIDRTFSATSYHIKNRIYISRENSNKSSSIAFEIAKLLNSPQLLEFLVLVIASTKQNLNHLLKLKNITPPPDEIVVISHNPNRDINPENEVIDSENNDNLEEGYFTDSAENNDELESEELLVSGTNLNTHDWQPKITADEISVNIERYIGESDNVDYEDKEGRTFPKSFLNTEISINGNNSVLSKKEREKIGNYGEEIVYRQFITNLIEKYQGLRIEEDTRQKIWRAFSGETPVVKLKWLNTKNIVQEGYDLVLIENEVKKFFEVKTSRGSENVVFSVTPAQWKFIKDKGEYYSIIRVMNADNESRRIIEINDPYRFWLEGKLRAYPINIVL